MTKQLHPELARHRSMVDAASHFIKGIEKCERLEEKIDKLKAELKECKKEAGASRRYYRKASGVSAKTLNTMLRKNRGSTNQTEVGRCGTVSTREMFDNYVDAIDKVVNHSS